MTNTKPEHDEDDLKTETETDRIAREGDEKGLSEFDRRFSHLNISSDDPRRTWYSYGYGDATLELTHARSRPEADIEADRLIQCRCIDMNSLQECSVCIEAEKAKERVRSRPEPAGEFDLESALIEKEKREEYGRENGFTDGARWQHEQTTAKYGYHSQPRGQTSDADAHLTLHKMADTKIRELESELAELKARVELTDDEKKLISDVELFRDRNLEILLDIIQRITSSRGNG